jgi:hypothetical protein
VLAHRQELVAQDAAAIERLTGQAPAMICSGLGRNDSPRAVRLGRRLGLSALAVNARTLAWALNAARPAEVDALIENGFWRITW